MIFVCFYEGDPTELVRCRKTEYFFDNIHIPFESQNLGQNKPKCLK